MKKKLFVLVAIFIVFQSVHSQIPNDGSNYYFFRDTTAANTGGNAYFALNLGYESLDITNAFTIDLWVQPTRAINMFSESNACAGSVSVPLAYSSQNWAIVPSGLGDGNMSVGLTIGTNGIMVGEHSANILVSRLSYTVPITDWVHVAIVYRSDSIFLYLDGEEVRGRETPCVTNTKCPAIGLTGYYYASDFKGNVDEFRLWDIPLTQSQIKNYKDKKFTSSVEGLRYYASFDNQNFERTLGDLGTSQMIVSGSITPERNIKKGNWGLTYAGLEQDSIYVSDTTIICGTSTASNVNLVSYYPFNGNANDFGSHGSDGTVNGATLTSDKDGNSNSAYYFDGVDDYISIPDSLPITDNFTIAFWGYNESTGSTTNIICDGSSSAGGNDFLLNLRGNEIGIRADKSGKSLNYEYSSPAGMTGLDIINKWCHYVWVMNPNYSKIYLNGVEIAHIDIQGTNLGYHDANSVIGARQVWGNQDNFFKGKLDDIRIYNEELNSDQISAVYQGNTSGNNELIEIPVKVSELTTEDGVISYQFDVTYDNSVLVYNSTDISGTISEGGTVTVNSSVENKLSISYMNSNVITGLGNLVMLYFNPIINDTTYISISNAYLNNNNLQSVYTGQIILKELDPPSAEITYDDTENRYGDELLITATFSEPMLETNAVSISMTGAASLAEADMTRVSEAVYTFVYTIPEADGEVTVSLSNGTDLWENEVESVPVSGSTFSIIPVNYGDVDEDGKILAYDAALTLQYSVGLDPLPTMDPLPWENWRITTANVDGTGTVTANDAGMILQHSAGIITSFDASAKKSVSQAFISIEVINNEIILYSYGDLLGLNVSAVNEDQILETPILMADNFLSAFNISGTTYSVGVCAANSPDNGVAVMKIPYTKSGTITLEMIVNTETDTRILNLNYTELTGTGEYLNGKINLYPNPAREKIRISGIDNTTSLSIYSAAGKLMYMDNSTSSKAEIDVSGLPPGLYMIKFKTDQQIVVKRFFVE